MTTNEGIPKPRHDRALEAARSRAPTRAPRAIAGTGAQPCLTDEHGHDRRAQAADRRRPTGRSRRAAGRARRRSRSCRSAAICSDEVREVRRGQEAVVGDGEDRPDQRRARSARAASRARPRASALDHARGPRSGASLRARRQLVDDGGAVRGGAHRRPARRPRREAGLRIAGAVGCRSAPVIAATISSRVVVAGRRSSPALRPSRSTKMRSATWKTSARLWEISDDAEPALAQPLDQLRAPARSGRRRAPRWARRACTTCGSPSSERAIATDWRCPPESSADLRADARASSPASESQQLAALLLHRDLVEPRSAGRPARAPRGRGTGSRRRRGCRTARGPGRRSRSPSCARVAGRVDRAPARRRSANSPSSAGPMPDDGLDERRLAGAVVADEGDDLAGVDVEVDAVERLHRAEALADAAQLEQRTGAGRRLGGAGLRLGGHPGYWIPASLHAGAYAPVQISVGL